MTSNRSEGNHFQFTQPLLLFFLFSRLSGYSLKRKLSLPKRKLKLIVFLALGLYRTLVHKSENLGTSTSVSSPILSSKKSRYPRLALKKKLSLLLMRFCARKLALSRSIENLYWSDSSLSNVLTSITPDKRSVYVALKPPVRTLSSSM